MKINLTLIISLFFLFALTANDKNAIILKVPLYQQKPRMCGPVDFQMVYDYHFPRNNINVVKLATENLKATGNWGTWPAEAGKTKNGKTSGLAYGMDIIARSLNFKAKGKSNGTFDIIRKAIDKNLPVIAGVGTGMTDVSGKDYSHFVVIIGYDDKGFYINDSYSDIDMKHKVASQYHVNFSRFQIAWESVKDSIDRVRNWYLILDPKEMF